jgi:hypothetical protein
MSHPDPCYDPDNSFEDDDMSYNYDDHDDFFDEDSSNYHPDADHEISTHSDDDENEEDDVWNDNYDDSMDGDWDSAMRDAGYGTDEDYGYYGEDY